MNEVLYKSINDVNYCNEFIDPNDALYVVVNTVEFSKFLDTL